MTRFVPLAFSALVLATFAAFFVAQELKGQPSVVLEFRRSPVVSPNRDGRFDRARVRFELKRRDRVTLAVVDSGGDEVRELLSGLDARPFQEVKAVWDGRDDGGALVPDGTYRYRITLQEQGRNVVVQRAVRLDTTPPRVRVLSVGPSKALGAELLPAAGGDPVRVRLQAPGRRLLVRVFKTAPGRPREVLAQRLPDGMTRWAWDGRLPDGRRASRGTYLAVAESRDRAGVIGRSAPLDERGLPRLPFGERLPGRGGIEVRYLAAQPPVLPVAAGARVDLLADARGAPFRWTVRRVGAPRPARRGGAPKRLPIVRLRAPAGTSGLFLFEVRTPGRVARAPFAVDDAAGHPVLIVLPVMSWQGANPVDDDGDGAPDVLDRGVAARLRRVLVRETESFVRREAPLLAWLDRRGFRYDLTTDVALAAGEGPRLEGHRGVLLPGDARWLPARLQQRLRRFVRGGGVVATAGIDSLRRAVTVSPRARLVRPTPAAPADLFGARVKPVVQAPTTLTNAVDDLGLFALPTTAGTAGVFRGFDAREELERWRPLAASAETEGGAPVIAAAKLGRGIVIRYGLPGLAARLDDAQVTALLERSWTLLSR